jgi:hypothetical protein
MSDIPDWEVKYWAMRQQQLAQQKQNTKVYPISSVNSRQEPIQWSQADQVSIGAGGYLEIDPVAMLQRKMMNDFIGSHASTHKAVFLREGAEYYRNIQGADGFGNVVPLVRSMGQLTGVVGKEFVVQGETRGFLIDGLTQVDLAKVNECSDRFGRYVIVSTPFVGRILVQRNAIIEIQQQSQRSILKG